MYINLTRDDIDYIYYHNLNLKITLKREIKGIKEVNLLFSSNCIMQKFISELIRDNTLILDDEYLCRKFISKK